MELAKIGKKGQITIPRSVLRAAGIAEESRVVLEATSDGAIVMRQAAVYPIEIYTDDRVREFEETNTIPAAMARRIEAYLKKARPKQKRGITEQRRSPAPDPSAPHKGGGRSP